MTMFAARCGARPFRIARPVALIRAALKSMLVRLAIVGIPPRRDPVGAILQSHLGDVVGRVLAPTLNREDFHEIGLLVVAIDEPVLDAADAD